MPKAQSKAFDFEKSLSELNNIVDTMEKGDLSLEASLEQFEKGIKLTRDCQKALKSAEQKVQLLVDRNKLTDFDTEVDDNA